MKGKILIEDLRIGNYVHDLNGNICQIGSIGPSNAIGFANEGSSVVDASCIADVKPIEITFSRLILLGFHKSNNSIGDRVVLNKNNLHVELLPDSRVAVYYGSNLDLICFCNYIHNLQNFYYSISGGELLFISRKHKKLKN